MSNEVKTGGCLCGAVRYQINGPIGDAHACHCTICRKQSGHFAVAVNADWQNMTIEGEDKVTWYASSEIAKRGFCSVCGSGLFWLSPEYGGNVSTGSLDQPSGTRLTYHIYVADKGDYYDIGDGLPQYDTYPATEGGSS